MFIPRAILYLVCIAESNSAKLEWQKLGKDRFEPMEKDHFIPTHLIKEITGKSPSKIVVFVC